MAASLVPDEAEDLRRWVERTSFGSLVPLQVDASIDWDVSGESAVFLDVTLPPPDPPDGTWPIEAVLALHEQIDARARELGLALPWHVRLTPASSGDDDPAEAEDEEE